MTMRDDTSRGLRSRTANLQLAADHAAALQAIDQATNEHEANAALLVALRLERQMRGEE